MNLWYFKIKDNRGEHLPWNPNCKKKLSNYTIANMLWTAQLLTNASYCGCLVTRFYHPINGREGRRRGISSGQPIWASLIIRSSLGNQYLPNNYAFLAQPTLNITNKSPSSVRLIPQSQPQFSRSTFFSRSLSSLSWEKNRALASLCARFVKKHDCDSLSLITVEKKIWVKGP